ncbi:DUF4232 domain-containing protein [Streptomyces sp. AM 2-1-1]|uniref:DUF4232 domain-containing protein n=1 Tax=Streptomyces sp. AM 2-1-1 TaxID=3028709 RepID=UPI0023B9F2DC|nr:DUF4232 domain-containing protein [Streptomyces sp. AM 2-1-1]WEH38487.1 DUF4232 domain-containing protein [Streptomyces sp. AM 2-1-1]
MNSSARNATAPTGPALRPRARRSGGLRRFGLLPVVTASIALAAAGCGDTSSTSTDPAGASRPVSGSATPGAPSSSGRPTTGGSPSVTSAAPSGPSDPAAPSQTSGAAGASASQRCAAEKLTMDLAPADAGAGQVYYRLTFTNTSAKTCTLKGYPGVSLIQRDGSVIGVPATHEGSAGTSKEIRPGGTAAVTLHTVNEGISDSPCWGRPDYLKVYPPGSTKALTLRTAQPLVCGDRFTTTAVSG